MSLLWHSLSCHVATVVVTKKAAVRPAGVAPSVSVSESCTRPSAPLSSRCCDLRDGFYLGGKINMAACFSSSPCRYFHPLLCSYRCVRFVPYTHDYSVIHNRNVCQPHAWSVSIQVFFLPFSPLVKFDWGFVSSGCVAGPLGVS